MDSLVYENGKYVMKKIEEENTINVDIPYEQLVVQFIRERYSLDEELAIQRQREVKLIEFEEYNNYCEECKIRAKELIGG